MSNVIGQDMVNRLYDCKVVDPSGEKIGSVKRVWLDGRTGDPLWASVHTGLFGHTESFVPLQRAELRADRLQVPVAKAQVKDSPRIEADLDQMTDEEQEALYRHYGFGPQSRGPDGSEGRQQRIRRPGSTQEKGDYPDPSRRERDVGTRSEERPTAGAGQAGTGKVRLVKHVVTEERGGAPRPHEEARSRREPITERNRATGLRGTGIGDGVRTPHPEKTVLRGETMPVEKGRPRETVPDSETVTGTVRKEANGDRNGDRKRRRR